MTRIPEGGIRCLIVLPADPEVLEIGGIASFVRGFVKFAPADFDIGMIGVSSSAEPWEWGSIRFEGRPLRFLSVLRADTRRRAPVPLALRFVTAMSGRAARAVRPDEILSFHRPGTDLPFRGVRTARWRVVHLTREDLTTPGSESRWRKLGGVLDRVEAGSFRAMDRIYVVNQQACERLARRFPDLASRFRYLPNWFDDTLFKPIHGGDEEGQRIRHRLGIPKDSRLVVFAGRLEGQKNPRLAVSAFAEVAAGQPDIHLAMAGGGSLRGDVERHVTAAGLGARVHLVGTLPRPQLADLMRTAQALVITSAFETGPTIGYEALASGLPVVTTDVGQIAEIVRQSSAGAVSDSALPEALGASLRAVLAASGPVARQAAVRAAAPYAASNVLAEVYEFHRAVASDRQSTGR